MMRSQEQQVKSAQAAATTSELRELQDELRGLIAECEAVLARSGDREATMRAQSYWLAQMQMAIDNDHDYLGGATCSMEDTINELEQNAQGE